MLHHKLQDMRKKRNLTLQYVADRSGHPLSTVSRVFSGETASPGFIIVRDIVYAMEGSLDDLADAKAATPAPVPQPSTAPNPPSDPVAKENKTLRILLGCFLGLCCLLLLLIIVALVVDFLNRRLGFFWLD